LQAYAAGQRSEVWLWLLSLGVLAAAVLAVLWLRRPREVLLRSNERRGADRYVSEAEVDLEMGHSFPAQPLQATAEQLEEGPPGLHARHLREATAEPLEEGPPGLHARHLREATAEPLEEGPPGLHARHLREEVLRMSAGLGDAGQASVGTLPPEADAQEVAAYPPGFTPEVAPVLEEAVLRVPANIAVVPWDEAWEPQAGDPLGQQGRVPRRLHITLPNWSKAWKHMVPHARAFEHARLIGPVGASPVSPARLWAAGGGPGGP